MAMDYQRTEEIEEWDSRLEECLLEKAGESGAFIKSRHIASELNVSSKKVGSAINRLMQVSSRINIEKWGGNSDGMTYYIEPVSQGANN